MTDRTIPFLRGSTVYLRPLAPGDVDGGYLEWFNDPEVCSGNQHHRAPFTRAEAETYISGVQRFDHEFVLAIVRTDNERHIGNIALKALHRVNRTAELAIVIGDRESWGRGYSKEASRLLLDHAFFELNLNRVYCGTFESNQPMRRLATYLGMKEEGCRRAHVFKAGRYHSMVEYGVLREEYIGKFGAPPVPQR
jgi:RimJ/RimL family protein N-acetyltransferase